MNQLFHHDVTGFLALRAGFSPADAAVIAISATMVDHALLPDVVHPAEGGVPYVLPVTHHFGFWSRDQEEPVWMSFHFFPGARSDSRRLDGRRSPWRVVPHSEPAKELFVAALRSGDPWRVGIAAHTYADTWAHQEFIGRNDDFNAFPGVLGLPPVGHAPAESFPDRIGLLWRDPRLAEPEVDNRARFLEAARMLYRYFATATRHGFADQDLVMAELEDCLGPELTPEPLAGVGTGIQSGVRRGLAAVRDLGRRLGALPGQDEGDGAESEGDPRSPRQRLVPDAHISERIRLACGLPPFVRGAWRAAALELPPGPDGDSDADGLNDKLAWLRHELLGRAGHPPREYRARPGLTGSALYRWSEAARAHAAAAASIIRNIR